MKILFTSFYKDKNQVRQTELETCITMNIENKLIDKIYLFLEGDINDFPYLKNEKVIIADNKRPTYKMFFDLINSVVSENDISIISNTDIIFDGTLALLDKFNFNNSCVALSRYHYFPDKTIKLHEEKFSQDTWIFKGAVKKIRYCDFFLGQRGCDNRIAYELNQAGYKVVNPAYSIKSIHYHVSEVRNYGNNLIPKPYMPVPLTKL